MKYFIIILTISILISCINKTGKELDVILIKRHFNKTERLELAKILDFTDSIVASNCQYSDIDEAYHHYIDSICYIEPDKF